METRGCFARYALLAMLLLGKASSALAEVRYTVELIPVPKQSWVVPLAVAKNESIYGVYQPPETNSGMTIFKWNRQSGFTTPLGLRGKNQSYSLVRLFADEKLLLTGRDGSVTECFYWKDGVKTPIPALAPTIVKDANESGLIVGYINSAGFTYTAATGMKSLPKISGSSGFAMACNERGDVVGEAELSQGRFAVAWLGATTPVVLARPAGYTYAGASFISESRVIYGTVSNSLASSAIVWNMDGSIKYLPPSPGFRMSTSTLWADETGRSSGTFWSPYAEGAAFWEPNGDFVPLSNYLSDHDRRYRIGQLTAPNGGGTMAGSSVQYSSATVSRLYLVKPVSH